MMNKYRISIKPGTPKAIPEDLTLTGVNYYVSRNSAFTDMAVEDMNSPELNNYKFEIELGEDKSLYIKTEYVYNNDPDTKSPPSRISSLKGDQRGIHISDSIVATPSINLDIDYTNNIDGELTVKTSNFRMYTSVGLHESTSWYVKNVQGKVLFESERDTINLTSIKLPDDIKVSDNIVIEVYHNASTLVSSNPGYRYNLNVNVSSNLFSVKQIGKLVTTRDVYFEFSINTLKYKSFAMTVLDGDGKPVYSDAEITNLYTFIPRDTLKRNINYTFEFKMDTGSGYSDVVKLTDVSTDMHINYLENTRYLDVYDYKHLLQTNGRVSQTTHQLYTGHILMTKNDSKTVYLHKYVNSSLVEIGEAFDLPVAEGIGAPELYIEQMANGDVVVAYTRQDSGYYMDVIIETYYFNPVTGSFKLLKTLNIGNRTDVVKSGSITCGWNDKIYYIDYSIENREPSIVEYDPVLFESTSVSLPFNAKANIGVLRNLDDDIVIIGGSDTHHTAENTKPGKRINDKVFTYSTTEKTFKEVGENVLSDIDDKYDSFLPVLRQDGSITLFLNIYNDNAETISDQHTYILDLKNKHLEKKDNDHVDNLPYLSTVILYGGDVIRISSLSNNIQKVYVYVSDTMVGSEVDDNNNIVRDLSKLNIGNGEVITEETLGQYDSIDITGDGLLHFITPHEKMTFNKYDLVITRDTFITRADYDARKYERVFALSANLTIGN